MTQDQIIFSIIGSGISLLLLVNAHFTRKTLEKITSVDLRLAVLITKHDSTDERSRKNQKEIETIRERIHALEGHAFQFKDFLNNRCPNYRDN